VCVAWEGSGAARAALFNGIGSVEIRAVTDAADKEAPSGSTLICQSPWQVSRAYCGCGCGKPETVRVLSGKKSGWTGLQKIFKL